MTVGAPAGAGPAGRPLATAFSGDPAPAPLRHHYVAFRAGVRAKVACLRHRQGDVTTGADASTYATLALQHLERGSVRLALVGGLPGTGKSTLGAAMAGSVRRSAALQRPGTQGTGRDRPG